MHWKQAERNKEYDECVFLPSFSV